MIFTQEEIDLKVSQCGGTWVKRRNLRKRLTKTSNDEIAVRIEVIKREVRLLKLDGFTEKDCRNLYENITKLELQLL